MNDSMNNSSSETEAERQWRSIEFEFNPDEATWIASPHDSRDCPECQRILQEYRRKQDRKADERRSR